MGPKLSFSLRRPFSVRAPSSCCPTSGLSSTVLSPCTHDSNKVLTGMILKKHRQQSHVPAPMSRVVENQNLQSSPGHTRHVRAVSERAEFLGIFAYSGEADKFHLGFHHCNFMLRKCLRTNSAGCSWARTKMNRQRATKHLPVQGVA